MDGKRQEGYSTQGHATVSAYFARKVWPTRLAGAVLLAIASPFILLMVIVVRLTSAGPGLFGQERSGRHGKEFRMYKIRTMYQDAESVSGPVWCIPGDSRITPVGKILRLLHLDELPQLINVARGEMDLIGPRPERPVFVARLARELPNYDARLQVLPGVTGLAQVNLPPDETVECVRRKLVLDCIYIGEASAGLDLRILLCTFLRMLGIRHGRAVHWLRLERPVPAWLESNQHENGDVVHRPQHVGFEAAAELYSNGHVNGETVAAAAGENGGAVFVTTLHEPARATELLPRRPK